MILSHGAPSEIERLHVLALASDVEENNGKNESETQFSFPI
jgi:hypothetical protein